MDKEIENLKRWCTNIDLDKADIRNEINARIPKVENDLRTLNTLVRTFNDLLAEIGRAKLTLQTDYKALKERVDKLEKPAKWLKWK